MPTGFEVEYYENIKLITFYLKQISTTLIQINKNLEKK